MYICDINKITMRVYIDVALHRFKGSFDQPLQVAEVILKNQYVSIIAGKRVASEITKQSDRYNTEIMSQCLSVCKNLLAFGRHDLTVPVLKQLGYDVTTKTPDEIALKVESLIKMNELKKARAEAAKNGREAASTGELTEDTFTRERVAMMSYYKMQFDLDRMTAAEYAHFLKRMCDELERDARLAKKRAKR